MYGQTEATARLSYLPPDSLDSKLGSIGKGMSGVTLRVLNEEGREVSPGKVGGVVAVIYLVDQAKDFLKCRDEKVSCRQIEEVLLEFDELVEAAVVGIPDGVLGEAVRALVSHEYEKPLV